MVRRVVGWVLGAPEDAKIDALIAANRATPRPEWARVSWPHVERMGARRWHQALRGQRRMEGERR